MQMYFGRPVLPGGSAVLPFLLLYALYESMIVVKVIKLRCRYQKQLL